MNQHCIALAISCTFLRLKYPACVLWKFFVCVCIVTESCLSLCTCTCVSMSNKIVTSNFPQLFLQFLFFLLLIFFFFAFVLSLFRVNCIVFLLYCDDDFVCMCNANTFTISFLYYYHVKILNSVAKGMNSLCGIWRWVEILPLILPSTCPLKSLLFLRV